MLHDQCGENRSEWCPKKDDFNQLLLIRFFDEKFEKKIACIIFVFCCSLRPHLYICHPHPALLQHMHPTKTGICPLAIGLAVLFLPPLLGSPAIFIALSSIFTPPFPPRLCLHEIPSGRSFCTPHHPSLVSNQSVDSEDRDKDSANGSSDVEI